MKIGVIQASSQKKINKLLYECTVTAARSAGHDIVNFGLLEEEKEEYTYVQTAFLVSLLLESEAVDFIVKGCSSGQGRVV